MRHTKLWAAGLAIGLLLASATPLWAQRGRPASRPSPRPPVVHPPGVEPGRPGTPGAEGRPGESPRPGSPESRRLGSLPHLGRPLRPFLFGRAPEATELKRQVAEELKAAEEQGREPRKRELENGIFVFLGQDSRRDPWVLREAERYRGELKQRPLTTGNTRLVTLLRDDFSRRAIRQAFAGLPVTALRTVREQSVLEAIASSPNGLVILVGHHEKGRMTFPGEAAEQGLDIAKLTAEAANHGTMVLPVGCGTGSAAPLGIAARRINSVEVVQALGAALRSSSDVWSFLTALGGTHGLTLNIATFEVPAVFEVRIEGQKEPWATVVLPPLQSQPGPIRPCDPSLDPGCREVSAFNSSRLPGLNPLQPEPLLSSPNDQLTTLPNGCPLENPNCADLDRASGDDRTSVASGLSFDVLANFLAAAILAALALVQWKHGNRGKAVLAGFGAVVAGMAPSFVFKGLLSCAGLGLFVVVLSLAAGGATALLEKGFEKLTGTTPPRDE